MSEKGIQRTHLSAPPIYPIFDSAQWFERLLPLVAQAPRHRERALWVQLRKKEGSISDIRQAIRQIKPLCAEYGCQLIINDYWQIALDEGCDFIHLGQEDLDTADMAAIRAAGVRLGVSTHDEAELERALRLSPDYVALGPVYHTQLKAMKWAPQGLEKLALWKQKVGDIPLIAIGGITIERAPAVFAAGADCVSMVTDISKNDHPEQRLMQWLQLCP